MQRTAKGGCYSGLRASVTHANKVAIAGKKQRNRRGKKHSGGQVERRQLWKSGALQVSKRARPKQEKNKRRKKGKRARSRHQQPTDT